MRNAIQLKLLTDDKGEPRFHVVTLPSFADREDLIAAYMEARTRKGIALARVFAAAIGLATRVGRESGTTFDAHNCNVYAFGGHVYGWLREKGVTTKDIVEQGSRIMDAVYEAAAPRAKEVADAERFSEAGGARTT